MLLIALYIYTMVCTDLLLYPVHMAGHHLTNGEQWITVEVSIGSLYA